MTTMLWGSQAEDFVRRCYERAMWGAEHARMRDAARRLELLEDDWKEQLSAHIRGLYQSEELFNLIRPHISTEHNLFKRIAGELSQVYKWGATRELADERQNEIAQLLWEEAEVDEALEQADLYDNALRDLLIVPQVDDGRMRLEVLPPSRFSVVQHPRIPSMATGFWFLRCVTEGPQTFLPWRSAQFEVEVVVADAQRWAVFDHRGKLKSELVHNLGRLPGVVVHSGRRTESFFCPTEFEDVVEATKTVGWLLTMVAYLQKQQAELVPTYQGDPEDIAEGVQLGAHNLLAAKGPFGTMNLQADPRYYLEHVRERIKLIAQNYGLSAEAYTLGGNLTSGFQFRMQRMPLLEARRKRVKKWRRIEHELYQLMAMVGQRFHPLFKRLDPNADFFVNFHDAPFVEDPKTELDVDEKTVAGNWASQIDVIMRRDPDLTRPMAVKKLRRILDEKAMVIGWQKELNTSDAPDAEERSPEENGRAGATAEAGGRDESTLRAALKKILGGRDAA